MDKQSQVALRERGFCKQRVISTDTKARAEVRKEVARIKRLEEKQAKKNERQYNFFDALEEED